MVLLLLACETQEPGFGTQEEDLTVRVDQLDLCGAGSPSQALEPTSNGVVGASPFGTGSLTVELGDLDDGSVVVPTPRVGAVDYDLDLGQERFFLHVPPEYDGTEPYGLLVHIDAGDGGAVRPDWIPLLADQRLIWVGPEGVGNNQDARRRIGLAALGAWRARELFNVDTRRVYMTGTSGGGRAGTMAALLHPGLFTGAMPVCGSAWLRPVEQAYETQEPDGHYEFWGEEYFPDVGDQPYADWYLGHGQRVALLTSYDDFREGDLQNIYHHGMAPDGVPVRLLEGEGGHCQTGPEAPRDALAWLDQPGWSLDEGFVGIGDLTLGRNRVQWDSPFGLRARGTVEGDGRLALVPWQPLVEVGALLSGPGLVVELRENTMRVLLDGEELLAAELDGVPSQVEVQWWTEELQIRTDRHFVDAQTSQGRVLDDRRVFQLRAPKAEGWDAGGLLVLEGDWSSSEVLDGTGLVCE